MGVQILQLRSPTFVSPPLRVLLGSCIQHLIFAALVVSAAPSNLVNSHIDVGLSVKVFKSFHTVR